MCFSSSGTSTIGGFIYDRNQSPIIPQPSDAPRDPRFGMLALLNGLIDQGGCSRRLRPGLVTRPDPWPSLANHFVDLGHLDASRRAAVEAIVSGSFAQRCPHRFLVGPVRRLGEEPVLPPHGFDKL